MNLTIRLSRELVERLDASAKKKGKTRNALIREAIARSLGGRKPSKWPATVLNYKGVRGFERFEDLRKDLHP